MNKAGTYLLTAGPGAGGGGGGAPDGEAAGRRPARDAPRGDGGVRSHYRVRKRGTEYFSDSGMKGMSR